MFAMDQRMKRTSLVGWMDSRRLKTGLLRRWKIVKTRNLKVAVNWEVLHLKTRKFEL
jgi:hypothetical protein